MLKQLLKTAKPVTGWSNYFVTPCGKIISTKYGKPRILRMLGAGTKRQYLTVCLSANSNQKRCYVHQIVATAFHGERPTGQCVRHLDGDSFNNHANNLAWGTWSANSMDRHTHGTMLQGSTSPTSKVTETQVRQIRNRYAQGYTQLQLANQFGVAFQTISRIVRRELWKHVV